MSTTYPSDLTDGEWECVQRYIPPLSTRGRPRTHPLRHILDAIFYLLRTGCAWRYLPSKFRPWQTVFYHFRRFRLQGLWHRLFTALRDAERERVGRHRHASAAIIDAQSVKTVEESARISGFDAHKWVKGRKRHLLVDTLGLPISLYVTPADMHEWCGRVIASVCGHMAACIVAWPHSGVYRRFRASASQASTVAPVVPGACYGTMKKVGSMSPSSVRAHFGLPSLARSARTMLTSCAVGPVAMGLPGETK